MPLDQFSSRATRAARGCAIALGFSIPISVALDNVLLVAVLFSWLAGGNFRERTAWLPEHRVAQAALGLFGLLAAGVAWSSQPAEGLHILGKYADLAFVPIFVSLFQARRDRRRAGAFLIAALLLTLALSYLTWAGLMPQGYPVIGSASEPEVFKKYLTQNILMACGAYFFALLARDATSPRARLLWAVLAALAAVNVALMLSGRSGQVILAALAAWFAFSVWHWRGVLLATGAGSIAAVVVIFGLCSTDGGLSGQAMLSPGQRDGRLNAVVRDLKAWQLGQAANTSTGQRLNYALHSAAIVLDHPFTGVGTGGFAAAYAHQVEGTGIEPTVNPHNEYLNIAVQLGMAGLLTLGLLFFFVWRHAAMLPTRLERDLARGLMIAFAVGSLFNSLLMDHAEGLFFAWGIGVLFGGLDTSRLPKAAPR